MSDLRERPGDRAARGGDAREIRDARERAAAARRSVEALRRVLEAKAREMGGAEVDLAKPADAIRLMADLWKAVSLAAEHERRLADVEGEGGGLDLDAARAEIARRLARLRDAG
jgi:hypothetical protein